MTVPDPGYRHGSADPALEARIVEQHALYYQDGAQLAADRPAHVRAASSLARVPAGIAVVQDDANFVALIDVATAGVTAIDLPRGREGARQFDDVRGNKRWKLDLEACFAVESGAGTRLIVLGSGSSPLRERIVVDRMGRGGRGPRTFARRRAPCSGACGKPGPGVAPASTSRAPSSSAATYAC